MKCLHEDSINQDDNMMYCPDCGEVYDILEGVNHK